MKYSELNDFYNVVEPDETVNEYFFNHVLPRTMWKLGGEQEEFLHMAGDKGKYPVMKSDALQFIHNQILEEIGWFTWELAYIIADQYYRGIVNVEGDTAYLMKEHFGWDFPDWETYPSEDGKVPYEEYDGKGPWAARSAFNFDNV